MVLRHSLRVMSSRFSLVYKVLLYIFIVLLLFSAITYAAVLPVIKPILVGIDNMDFFSHILDAFKSIFSFNSDVQTGAFEQISIDLSAISEVFATNQNNVIVGAILFTIFIFLCKFFVSFSKLPACDVLNNFMNSNSKYGFTSNMIANAKKASAFSLIDTLITIPYYVLVGVILYYVGYACSFVMVWLSLVSVLTLLILFVSLKSAILNLWLPYYINEDKGVFKSLSNSILMNKKYILNNLGLYVITYFILYGITIGFSIITFGIGFIFAISINQMLLLAIQLVVYYRINEKKYYIDPETVVNSKTVVKSVY